MLSMPYPRRCILSYSIALLAQLGAPKRKATAIDSTPAAVNSLARQNLLNALQHQDGGEVEFFIDQLLQSDPSNGNGAVDTALGGNWRLLWSARAEAFSPLLNLPPGLRPESYQLLGEAAARQVGSGRIAQVLDFPFGLHARLSSGAVADNSSTLRIEPPFRLDFGIGPLPPFTVVESGSDADFRALNARNAAAQAAPRNRLVVEYLDVSGTGGDLRVSRVVDGDPVIVGSRFLHQRVID